MHTPVMLEQTLELLQVKPGKKYVDATYGMGGHSKAIADQGGMVLALEWDGQSFDKRTQELQNGSIKLVQGNFADIQSLATDHDFVPVDGVLFDYGLSMWQIRESGKGFTYEQDDEQLDMRIDSSLTLTASDIVNNYSEDQLNEIFTKNAEEIHSRSIAHALVQSRRIAPIHTVGDLKASIQTVTRDAGSMARIFQALRIEVNAEYDNIIKGLRGAYAILSPGGRIVTITFHPSEDRLVKSWARDNAIESSKKALKSTSRRSFERSALLRVMTKRA